MHNQRGFVSAAVLIAIVLGLIVVGGGAYYVVQQQAPTQTASENFDDLQQLTTSNNQAQTQTKTNTQVDASTQNPAAQGNIIKKPSATIDSLVLTSTNRTITGTASGVSHVNVGLYYRNSAGFTGWKMVNAANVADNIPVVNGRWSFTVSGNDDLVNGTIFRVIYDGPKAGTDDAIDLASGPITTSASSKSAVEVVSLSYPSLTYRINPLEDSTAWLRIIDVASGLSMWQKSEIAVGTRDINLTSLDLPYESRKISLAPGTYRLRLEVFVAGVGKTLAESGTFTVPGTAVAVPTCTVKGNLSANPTTLTWTSKNADEAYLAHSPGMGGSAIIYGLNNGKKVSLTGSETVSVVANDYYWLVVKNTRGATYCSPDGTTFFNSQYEIDNPGTMG